MLSENRGDSSGLVHVTNARSGALQKQLSLAFVARERCGAFEFRAGFGGATEFGEQVATHARQELIVFESGSRNQPIDNFQARCRAERAARFLVSKLRLRKIRGDAVPAVGGTRG
ncbi:MAG: hypothetical protein IPI57_02975 [Candidatus Competibacteraceae bacterium]|nr:hypothetical protein [Candidatus Competibacteraceae bacterium]